MYKVGGCVRDKYLGIQSKDIDYAVEAPSFEAMREAVKERGGEIFLEKPEYFTIRGKVYGEACDFTLCRKESDYSDGRRPDSVQPCSIYQDLARRDATCNAIAEAEDGEIIDLFGGIEHIKENMLVAVGKPADRIEEDGLRMLRYIRFAITKKLFLDYRLHSFFKHTLPFIKNPLYNVSVERVREELHKCFAFDTSKTLYLFKIYALDNFVFDAHPNLKLLPSLKNKLSY